MAQSKKVASPVAASKTVKATPAALKHKSAGAGKPTEKHPVKSAKPTAEPAVQPAAKSTSTLNSKQTATPTKPAAAKVASAKIKNNPENVVTAAKKVDVKPVAKTATTPATKSTAAAAPKAAPKAVAAKATKVAAPTAPKGVFNKESVRAATPTPAASPVKAMPAAVAKPAAQRISAPVAASKAAAAPVAVVSAAAAAAKKSVSARHGFKTNEYIVYPAHGVGRIVGIEEQEIAGMALELFVITFDKDKMTLRVPTGKLQSVGMRKLAEEPVVRRAMETLKGRARVKRTMWSRRAQEYEAKINSGDLVAIAEVVRDLFRSETQPEQSYSERQLYEAALDRMARELAAVEKLDERGAVQRITEILAKSAKGRRLAAEGAEAEAAASEADDSEDADIKAA
jgi:CarD family transcriptional regulator